MLHVHAVAEEAVIALGPLINAIARRDKSLADQLRRAGTSVLLNIAEGERSDAGNARARFHTAAGSAREARAALALAVAWQYVMPAERARVERLLDQVGGMLYRLLNPKRA
jgi:four helix bundle protein